jgi:very-short-patch-repair endonuclease
MRKPPLPPELLRRCRELRRTATDAENLLWQLLRNRQLAGAKFRRQHPLRGYILDFYCHDARLTVELDGSGHAEPTQAAYDAERTRILQAEGVRVLRFWNNEVLQRTTDVLEAIWDALTPALFQREREPEAATSSDQPLPSPGGRGAGGEGAFRQFVDTGARLADLHLNYEQAKEYPLQWLENKDVPFSWLVTKMQLSKDKTQIKVNESLTLAGIPAECFAYRLGNRSALEWVIDQYRVSTDKRSGITSDPNRADDEEYIVRLVGRVVTVSVETVKLVGALPLVVEEAVTEAT